MPPERETVARNLRTARENRGLSQDAVAKKLRVSRTLIAQIELGNRPVTEDELRVAAGHGLTAGELLPMVTETAARILKLPDAGRIAVGLPADLVVLPPSAATAADALLAAKRRDLALVTLGGRPVVGCPSLSAVFVARRTPAQPVNVDGMERLVACRVARAIARCPISEPGVESLS